MADDAASGSRVSQEVPAKILDVDQLTARRRELREEGLTVVQCHGCFDIVHPGHLRYLQFAKEQGDILVVSVSSDRQVGKGVGRPYIHENLRLENLAALELVDYVCLDDNSWAGPILEALQPDIYVKGKEYERKADPRFLRERELVEAYGGTVIFSSGDVVFSSTTILEELGKTFRLESEKISFFCRRHGIGRHKIHSALEAIRGRRVLVVGDPVFDRYVHCESLGVAAESPVLDVAPVSEEWYLGAAGFVAAQCSVLGAEVSFLTVAGASEHRERLRRELDRFGIEPLVEIDERRPVYEKVRYLVDETKVFKVNKGRYAPLSTRTVARVLDTLERTVRAFDAVLVLDFGYGFFTEPVLNALSEIPQKHGTPYYFDVSRGGAGNLLRLLHSGLVTPTEDELRFAFGDRESGLSHLAARFYRKSKAERLVITLGKRGVVLFSPPEHDEQERLASDYLPSLADVPRDAVGAGDAFLTGASLAVLSGHDLPLASYLGSALAALHVAHLGNEPVDRNDLDLWLDRRLELRPSEHPSARSL